MRLIWSPEALQDLRELRAYIANENPAAAKKVAERIIFLVKQLPENPEIGRPGRVPDTRELVVSRTPFVVPYRVAADRIDILRVCHSARLWPDSL